HSCLPSSGRQECLPHGGKRCPDRPGHLYMNGCTLRERLEGERGARIGTYLLRCRNTVDGPAAFPRSEESDMKDLTNGKPDGRVVRGDVAAVTRALAARFDAREVKFKPAVVTGNRALALAYVDARVIQDRLDEVLGVEGWQDDYEFLPDGSVVCRLRGPPGDEGLA